MQFPVDICTCVLRKNLDLTQIHDEALVIVKKSNRLRMCRCLTITSDRAVWEPRNNSQKTMTGDFHPMNNFIALCIVVLFPLAFVKIPPLLIFEIFVCTKIMVQLSSITLSCTSLFMAYLFTTYVILASQKLQC